jgi:hypothetical protein
VSFAQSSASRLTGTPIHMSIIVCSGVTKEAMTMLYPLTHDQIVNESNNLEQALFALRCWIECPDLLESIRRYNRHNALTADYETDAFRFTAQAAELELNRWHP